MFQFHNFVTLSFLLFFSSAFADDDCLWCSIGSGLGDGIVHGAEWLWDGAVGATEDVKGLLRPPSQPPQPNLFLPPDTPTTTVNPESQTPDDVIHLTVSDTPDPKPPMLRDDKCNSGSPLDVLDTNSCGIATKKIIWPTSCNDVAANVNILNALIAITKSAEKVGISTDLCGTSFWTASLTEEQMEKLTRDTPGIYDVVPDTTGQWNRFSGKRGRRERRDTVVVESDASPDLSYISTPPLTPNPESKYAHFSNSGSGVTVYIIDAGAVRTLRDFTTNNVIKGYIYALGAQPQKTDQNNHGSCIASKVGGFRDGVAKKADLIIVQIEIEISSLLDALDRVLVDCQTRADVNQNVRGYTVIQIAVGHKGKLSDTNTIKLIGLIQELIERFQTIVVLASENLGYELSGEGVLDMWNEILHRKPVIPVIVVGAVDVRTGNPPLSTTSIAEDLTVSALDSGFCADSSWWNLLGRQVMPGNSIASAVVSGMVADYLSRDYIRDHLGLDLPENQNSIAQLLRDYVVSKAFRRRQGTALCIWNGLYFNNPLRVEP